MSTMVERVAEFLQLRDESVMPDEVTPEERKASAAAIIDLMRVPTETMVLAGLNCEAWAEGDDGAVKMLSGTYDAMIDAALKEGSTPPSPSSACASSWGSGPTLP